MDRRTFLKSAGALALHPLWVGCGTTPTPAEADWFSAFRDLPREHGFEPLSVQGRIPRDLTGTVYRVGPGLFSNFGHPYQTWFDGDGAVSAVRLENGTARGAVRVIESEALKAERREGKPLYTSVGTLLPKGTRSAGYKNPANTNVLPWNERLFGLFEGGKPTEVSTEDLTTLGETDFGGVIKGAFSAHPHYSPEHRAVFNVGLTVTPLLTLVNLYELKAGGAARHMGSVPVPGLIMLHDFMITRRHIVFFDVPIRVRWEDVLQGRTSVMDALDWKPEEGTDVVVVPIDDPKKYVRFKVDPFFMFHHANAYERGNELIVDFVRYDAYPQVHKLISDIVKGKLPSAPRTAYARAIINPKAKTMRTEERWSRLCEFPRVPRQRQGRPHRTAYLVVYAPGRAAQKAPPTRIAKIDVESGSAREFEFGPYQFPSEPLFAPRPNARTEDDGHLLVQVYDSRERLTHLAILDARDPEAGPVARAGFDHFIPLPFHGDWDPL